VHICRHSGDRALVTNQGFEVTIGREMPSAGAACAHMLIGGAPVPPNQLIIDVGRKKLLYVLPAIHLKPSHLLRIGLQYG
jgi:hypothetical protein